jgi:hypothetical protein
MTPYLHFMKGSPPLSLCDTFPTGWAIVPFRGKLSTSGTVSGVAEAVPQFPILVGKMSAKPAETPATITHSGVAA